MTTLPQRTPPANAQALPYTISQCRRIEKYVKALHRLFNTSNLSACEVRVWSPGEVAQAKQLLAQREAMRSAWAVMSQPASTEQIGIATSYLVTSFFTLPKSERENITLILCEDIAAEEPSLYMLASMVRTVRHGCEFLSVATVVKTLSQAGRAARRCEQVLTNSAQIEHDIEHAEQQWPLIAKQEAAYKARRLKQLRVSVKDFPPEYCFYSDADLELLGLTREEGTLHARGRKTDQ